jgi:hypothetical protein
MLRTVLVVTLLLTLTTVPISSAQRKPTPPILKVAVMTDGRVTVNGAPATLESFRESLKELSKQKGVVWYYREAGTSEPPPQAKLAIQAIIEAKLPVRLSSRPDYSDAIGMEGKPIKQ